MTIFSRVKQRLEDMIGAMKSVEAPTSLAGSDGYLCGVVTGLQFALAILCSEEEQEKTNAPKTAAVTEWAKDHPELQVQDLPCREVDPEDLKGLPTIND